MASGGRGASSVCQVGRCSGGRLATTRRRMASAIRSDIGVGAGEGEIDGGKPGLERLACDELPGGREPVHEPLGVPEVEHDHWRHSRADGPRRQSPPAIRSCRPAGGYRGCPHRRSPAARAPRRRIGAAGEPRWYRAPRAPQTSAATSAALQPDPGGHHGSRDYQLAVDGAARGDDDNSLHVTA